MYKDRDEQQLIARGARGMKTGMKTDMKTGMRGEGGGGQPPAHPNLSYIYISNILAWVVDQVIIQEGTNNF